MDKENRTKFQFSARIVCSYILKLCQKLPQFYKNLDKICAENKIIVNSAAPRTLWLSEENLYLKDFITFNSRLLLPTTEVVLTDIP